MSRGIISVYQAFKYQRMPLVYLARNSLKLIIVCARKALSVGKHRYLLVYLLYLAAAFYIRFAAVTSRDDRAFSDLGAVRMLVINNACAAVMDHRLIAQEHALERYVLRHAVGERGLRGHLFSAGKKGLTDKENQHENGQHKDNDRGPCGIHYSSSAFS